MYNNQLSDETMMRLVFKCRDGDETETELDDQSF